ncbi:beta family protein [Streptomyces tauricus]|uniref:beta family protein n=1 Tax=Streptomyces tauricus TaxID=68274 RepID=UPI003425A17A
MVEPIYVPVLPARQSAWSAYEQLDLHVRRRVAPLWTVMPHVGRERLRGERPAPEPDGDRSALDRWLTPHVDRLITAVDGTNGWVDAVHVEAGTSGAAVALWRLTTRSGLRLVTGPERHPAIQRCTADLAVLSGRGIGIRVLVDAPSDQPRAAELSDMMDRLVLLPERTDLILDMGAAVDSVEAGKALDLLGGLVPWRTIVLTSGAFPRWNDSPGRESTRVGRRQDRQLYQEVRAARPGFPRNVVYGDYSVEHPFSANTAFVNDRRPPWSLMRYTTRDGFLIGRAPTRDSGGVRGADRIDRVRATARWITESDAFRGAGYGEGEAWLHACAHGEGAKGSGSAETWIRMGHIQHMEFVVRQLAGSAVL